MRIAQALETDRIALMIFSEKARIYCPLTKDIDLVKSFLENLDHTTLSAGTTCLDQPIRCALAQCQRNPDRKHNILLMVSDGEDFSGSLDGLQEQARSCGLTILVTGIGTTQGAPIPLYDEKKQRTGYLKDAHDRVVISQLNKPVLEKLAKNTGGLALFVEKSDISVDQLILRIKQFDKELQCMVRMPSLKEQYPWFLGVGFVCLLLEWVL
jgi:Ca-activated chloride channel family protein